MITTEVMEPTSKEYEGKTINRIAIAMASWKVWMTFYDDGKLQEIQQYPEQELYKDSRAFWTKTYYPSDCTRIIPQRKDTAETWFRRWRAEITIHRIQEKVILHTNAGSSSTTIASWKKYMERYFETTLSSELDPAFRRTDDRTPSLRGRIF